MSALVTTSQHQREARERAASIVRDFTSALSSMRVALELEDWRALGYESPVAWAEDLFGDLLAQIVPALEAATRQQLVVAYRQAGYGSTRVVAERLGISASAVSAATRGVALPAKTKGKDGRERPSKAPAKPVLTLVPDLPADVADEPQRAQHLVVADLVTASQRAGMTVKDVLAVMVDEGWHHGHASGALSRAKRQGLIVASETRRDGCVAWVDPRWL